jgi:tetratricopeptide (TPR) repeat protein
LGQLDLALADAERAVALDGGNRWGWHQLGLVCSKLKKWTRSTEVYQRLLEFEPNDSSYWWRYTIALVASGQLTKYREFCAELLERHGQTDDPLIANGLIGSLCLGPDVVDDWSVPLRLSQFVLNSESVNHEMKSHVSELLCRAGEYERSLEMRAEAIAEAGREPHASDCCWQAMAHQGLGNIDQARDLASRARELADSGRLGTPNQEFEISFTELTGKLNEPAEPPSKEDATDIATKEQP